MEEQKVTVKGNVNPQDVKGTGSHEPVCGTFTNPFHENSVGIRLESSNQRTRQKRTKKIIKLINDDS